MEGKNLRVTYGFLRTLILIVGYLLLSLCTGLFLHRFLKLKGVLRKQAGIIIFSTLITGTCYFYWIFSKVSFHEQILPVAFILSGFLDAYAFFRLRMFDLITVAQSVVTQIMGDGLVVLDNNGVIVGLNPAAEKMTGRSNGEVCGSLIGDIFGSWPEFMNFISKITAGSSEFYLNNRYYHVFIAPLVKQSQGEPGSVLVFHDITVEKAARELMIEQRQAVAILKERDRIGRELHDGQGAIIGLFKHAA